MKKVSVITGGSSGLGLELAKQLQNHTNSTICLISKTKTKMDEAIKHLTGNVISFIGDISDENFVKNTFSTLQKQGYTIDYLFNNAGVGLFGNPDENTADITTSVINTNLIGTILVTNYAIPLMKDNGGKIINILSSAALKGNPYESLYCASKWGVRGFTESLKSYYKGTNIKVVGVYPGGMNTQFWNNSRNYVSNEKSNTFMDPANVAKIILNNITEPTVSVADIVIERP